MIELDFKLISFLTQSYQISHRATQIENLPFVIYIFKIYPTLIWSCWLFFRFTYKINTITKMWTVDVTTLKEITHSLSIHGQLSSTYKRLIHCPLDFIWAIRVDLLEQLVEGSVPLQLLCLFLLLYFTYHLVPVACVVGGWWVLV